MNVLFPEMEGISELDPLLFWGTVSSHTVEWLRGTLTLHVLTFDSEPVRIFFFVLFFVFVVTSKLLPNLQQGLAQLSAVFTPHCRSNGCSKASELENLTFGIISDLTAASERESLKAWLLHWLKLHRLVGFENMWKYQPSLSREVDLALPVCNSK